MRLKCCVGGCNATNEQLFAFPRNDQLRNLWMSFLVPTNPFLIGLSKEQLFRKRVCKRHFDQHQFDGEGNRIRFSYPCLFTDMGITHGEPFPAPGTVRDALSDHNYFKDRNDEEDMTGVTLVIGRPCEDFHEHPSCLHSQSDTSAQDDKDKDFLEPELSHDHSPGVAITAVSGEKDVDLRAHLQLSHSQAVTVVSEEKVRDALSDHNYFKEQNDEEDKKESTLALGRPDVDLRAHLQLSHSQAVTVVSEEEVRDALSDHNYFKEQNDEEDKTESTLALGRPDADLRAHLQLSHSQAITVVSEEEVRDASSDHNYFKEQNDEEDKTESTLAIGRPAEYFHEDPSSPDFQAVTPAQEDGDLNLEERSGSLSTAIEEAVSLEHTTTSHSVGAEKVTRQRKGSIMKKLGSKRRKIVKTVLNIATASLGHTSGQRLSQAISHGNNEQLLKNFKHLNRQAQTFLLMQLKQCRKNKMARRFTMDEKLMALILMKQSPKSYKLLETMFALPNKRTLHRLSEKISMKPGVNPQVFKHIQNTVKYWGRQQKLCTIVFDEIALTPYLTFNEKNDLIHGFVDVAGERKMKFCDHALVFMVRGICSSWRQCVAYYFCEGTTSTVELQNILKQIVTQVAQTGLIPLGLVCDQGSTFRTTLKKFREERIRNNNNDNNGETEIGDDGTIYVAGYNLSIFFDPPHLLKGIRNNFLNKDIIWEGKRASWKDIQYIYDVDSKLGHTRALPKLTAHHVDPNKIKKMKVSVAAQVFSSRMAAMLNYTAEHDNRHRQAGSRAITSRTMEATAEIVEFFDTLFDSVNGSIGGAKRGKLRKAVKKSSGHIPFWLQAIEKLKNIKYIDTVSKLAVRQGNPRIVRVPSLEGWMTTIESLIRITKLLLNEYGVEYYYPRNINQDPLENFFGRIRALNGRNVKPNSDSFIYAFKSLVLTNLLSPQSKFANCEVDNGENLLDVSFLFECDSEKENERPEINSLPSTSQEHPRGSRGQSSDEPLFEKMKMQCSAYTAGYICRKITKTINCQSCLNTYISSSKEEHHAYIQHREFKRLKRDNLKYPTEKLLNLYMESSQSIHNYLNENCFKKDVGTNLFKKLENYLRISWLGCGLHKNKIKLIFLKNVIRLQVHNWCNIINKILKGDIEEKYASKMEQPQKLAYKKYKTYKMRQKAINK